LGIAESRRSGLQIVRPADLAVGRTTKQKNGLACHTANLTLQDVNVLNARSYAVNDVTEMQNPPLCSLFVRYILCNRGFDNSGHDREEVDVRQ